MVFFTSEIMSALAQNDMGARQIVTKRLFNLHEQIYGQMQSSDIELHIITVPNKVVKIGSICDATAKDVLSLAYLRSSRQAVTVERLMGREAVANEKNIEERRHLTVEIRLSQEKFVIELLMSPDAWWDQQNLVGKLSIARHKQDFYARLGHFPINYCLGFWKGIHLSEMHLKSAHFQHPRIMDEWMSTFQPNADWFRIGIWYDLDDEALSEDHIAIEVMKQIRLLYELYEYTRWSNDNNFREFYDDTR